MRLRITCKNWPTVMSPGVRNLHLSKTGAVEERAASIIMGMREGYERRMRADSERRLSTKLDGVVLGAYGPKL